MMGRPRGRPKGSTNKKKRKNGPEKKEVVRKKRGQAHTSAEKKGPLRNKGQEGTTTRNVTSTRDGAKRRENSGWTSASKQPDSWSGSGHLNDQGSWLGGERL